MNDPENMEKGKDSLEPAGKDKKKDLVDFSVSPNALSKSQIKRQSYFTKLTVQEIAKELKRVDPGFLKISGSSSISGKIKDDKLIVEMLSSITINNLHRTHQLFFDVVSDENGTRLIACEAQHNRKAGVLKIVLLVIIGFIYFRAIGMNLFAHSSPSTIFALMIMLAIAVAIFMGSRLLLSRLFPGLVVNQQNAMEGFIVKNLKAEPIEISGENNITT